jgi:hypothetical protein
MGHEGVAKSLHQLRANFYIPHTQHVMQDFIRARVMCQRNKVEHLHPASLLQPLDVPSMVWADVAMDFIEGFPRVNNQSVILTLIDRFSKSAHFIKLGHLYTATSVAQEFFTNIIRLHGMPKSIVSDRDPVFMSRF